MQSVVSYGYLLIPLVALNLVWMMLDILAHPANPEVRLDALWLILIGNLVMMGSYDFAFGRNMSNPEGSMGLYIGTVRWFLSRLILWLMLPITGVTVVVASAAYAVIPGDQILGKVGFILVCGFYAAGLCIVVGHELVHSNSKFDRTVGGLLLCLVCYASFKIEHVRGHHDHVATPEDPSSAKRGQSFYAFLPTAILRNIHKAWELERKRLAGSSRTGKILRNEMLGWTVIELLLVFTILFTLGALAAFFFVISALVAIAVLELINYVQHYGLRRRRLEDGNYERVDKNHSWNSPYWYTQFIFANLMRHSDHHLYEKRPYQILRVSNDMPLLPFPVHWCFLIAFIPPLWFWIMDPIVDYYNELNHSSDGRDMDGEIEDISPRIAALTRT